MPESVEDLIGQAMNRIAEIWTPGPDQHQYTFQPGQRVRIARAGKATTQHWTGYEAQVRHSYCDEGGEIVVLGALGPRPDDSDFGWFIWSAADLEPCGQEIHP